MKDKNTNRTAQSFCHQLRPVHLTTFTLKIIDHSLTLNLPPLPAHAYAHHSPSQHDRTVHERVPGLQQRGGVCGVQGALPQGPQNASSGLPTGLILQLRQGPLVLMLARRFRLS